MRKIEKTEKFTILFSFLFFFSVNLLAVLTFGNSPTKTLSWATLDLDIDSGKKLDFHWECLGNPIQLKKLCFLTFVLWSASSVAERANISFKTRAYLLLKKHSSDAKSNLRSQGYKEKNQRTFKAWGSRKRVDFLDPHEFIYGLVSFSHSFKRLCVRIMVAACTSLL